VLQLPEREWRWVSVCSDPARDLRTCDVAILSVSAPITGATTSLLQRVEVPSGEVGCAQVCGSRELQALDPPAALPTGMSDRLGLLRARPFQLPGWSSDQ